MSLEKGTPNELIHATSPYLLQHAYNPVAWREWGAAALNLAKQSDKPILVSIGYSSCHWCHVMERESFEHDDVARIMNEYFVCIKVDREERPDIDQIYMEAVQAMGGHGGWPLNVFLTPDQKPFYGGTYFPAANWVHLMKQIHATFNEKRSDLEKSAEELTRHVGVSDLRRFSNKSVEFRSVRTQTGETEEFGVADLEKMFSILHDRFDDTWGGLEKSPKFVMPSIWLFILRYYAISKNPEALEMVRFTLVKMQQGGLYDQLGGGFSRYSVDARWFAPHFEKMLYDNAQLLTLYAEAYMLTKDASFKRVVFETVGWLKREMMHVEGSFYSALDADSENIEGKFYSWTYAELEEVLGDDTPAMANYYQCTREGNWEHSRNILMDTSGIPPTEAIQKSIDLLLKNRNTRIRPGLDDKILTGWNAMMIKGLTDAYNAFGESEFLLLAENCMRFLEEKLLADGKFFRSHKNKKSTTEGFLEDYAFLIEAYTALYECTFNEAYLFQAEHWCNYVVANFTDEKEGYFNFTSNQSEQLIARKKEIFDNVIPGSNSVMAQNLYHLGILLDKEEWKQLSLKMLSGLQDIIRSEPGYLSNWGILMAEHVKGMAEIVIVGKDVAEKRKELVTNFIPFKVMLGAERESKLPLFEGRSAVDDRTRVYVCYNKTCQLPSENVADALKQLDTRIL